MPFGYSTEVKILQRISLEAFKRDQISICNEKTASATCDTQYYRIVIEDITS